MSFRMNLIDSPEEKQAEQKSRIIDFQSAINKLFALTGKRIEIEGSKFSVITAKGILPIEALSSGEKQILLILLRVSSWLDIDKVHDVVDRLVDPLDNAFNEKCSRIKAAFAAIMDEYSAAYYAISGHKLRHISASSR